MILVGTSPHALLFPNSTMTFLYSDLVIRLGFLYLEVPTAVGKINMTNFINI